MEGMKPRQRVRRALDHREPDRVPVDFGGSAVTGIAVAAYERLKSALGVGGETAVLSRAFQIAQPAEEVMQALGADFRPVYLRGPARGGLVELDGDHLRDEWGIVYRRPPGGLYYDMVSFPLSAAGVEDLSRYPWPDPVDPARFSSVRETAEALHRDTDYALIGPGSGISLFEAAMCLRGHAAFLRDLVLNPGFVRSLLGKLLELRTATLGEYLRRAGRYLDVVNVSDDLGSQGGPLLSPTLYRQLVKPYHVELFRFIRQHTDARIMLHSCGDVVALLDDLIDAGVDCINPVQVSALRLSSRELKARFGSRVVFWGAIDTQEVLCQGTPEQVEDEVRRRIADLAPGGGYVLSAVHNIQPDVPPENILAMTEAARRWGRYPIDTATEAPPPSAPGGGKAGRPFS
ncbi:MAG: uroporphyrinogen decarboxylase family protein [Acetobacteraceae bacterium]|nr:uroporphyrinogen decarboxylase family protein [Acetobacteraceae bacterium]